jgi:hypothetical protein
MVKRNCQTRASLRCPSPKPQNTSTWSTEQQRRPGDGSQESQSGNSDEQSREPKEAEKPKEEKVVKEKVLDSIGPMMRPWPTWKEKAKETEPTPAAKVSAGTRTPKTDRATLWSAEFATAKNTSRQIVPSQKAREKESLPHQVPEYHLLSPA